MDRISLATAKLWVKTSHHPLAQFVKRLHFTLRFFELPSPRFLFRHIYQLFRLLQAVWGHFTRILVWTPLFKSQLTHHRGQLYLYGGMPYCSGPLEIFMGSRVRLSGQSTFTGRAGSKQMPRLIIGDNVGIGWMTTMAVGGRITIGDNVRIAGRSVLAGYPGHPLNATDRAAGLPDTDEQVGDITLERDVWLGTGVIVTSGVCIGEGTIVAAGSVVTKDLPPYVLAAGVPARVVRTLEK